MAIGVTKGTRTDASALMGHLHDFSKVLGRELGEVVREQAGLFCMDMAKRTRPFTSPGKGLTGDSKRKGMENVKSSIMRIFKPLEAASKYEVAAIDRYDVFKWWTAIHGEQTIGPTKPHRWQSFKMKYAGGRAIPFIDSGDISTMQTMHTKLRKFSGKGGLVEYARESKNAFGIVRNNKTIKDYITKKQKDVGSLKSGYYYAARKIRAKDIDAPAWIQKSEGEQYGIGIDNIVQEMMPEATVGNTVGLRSTPPGLVKDAISYRAYAMRVKMAAELNKRKIPLWEACAKGMTSNTFKRF